MLRASSAEELLRARDIAFDTAFSTGAIDQLAALLAPDFVYTHSTGQRQARAEFLTAIAARPTRSTRRLSDIEVELHASIAVTSGSLTIAYPTGRPDHYLHYVRVHRADGASWRTISHHTFHHGDRADG